MLKNFLEICDNLKKFTGESHSLEILEKLRERYECIEVYVHVFFQGVLNNIFISSYCKNIVCNKYNMLNMS